MSATQLIVHNVKSIETTVTHFKDFVNQEWVFVCEDGSKHTVSAFAKERLQVPEPAVSFFQTEEDK